MDFLDQENQRLREELKAALEEIQSLKDENILLKSQIKDPSFKLKAGIISPR